MEYIQNSRSIPHTIFMGPVPNPTKAHMSRSRLQDNLWLQPTLRVSTIQLQMMLSWGQLLLGS